MFLIRGNQGSVGWLTKRMSYQWLPPASVRGQNNLFQLYLFYYPLPIFISKLSVFSRILSFSVTHFLLWKSVHEKNTFCYFNFTEKQSWSVARPCLCFITLGSLSLTKEFISQRRIPLLRKQTWQSWRHVRTIYLKTDTKSTTSIQITTNTCTLIFPNQLALYSNFKTQEWICFSWIQASPNPLINAILVIFTFIKVNTYHCKFNFANLLGKQYKTKYWLFYSSSSCYRMYLSLTWAGHKNFVQDYLKAGVHMNRSEISSNIKRELLGLK